MELEQAVKVVKEIPQAKEAILALLEAARLERENQLLRCKADPSDLLMARCYLEGHDKTYNLIKKLLAPKTAD